MEEETGANEGEGRGLHTNTPVAAVVVITLSYCHNLVRGHAPVVK